MELSLVRKRYYRVKRGQTVYAIAKTFGLTAKVLAAHNGLTEEVRGGEVLEIPAIRRNLYTVRGGESKSLLCGSPEQFEERNATKLFYPGQEILL